MENIPTFSEGRTGPSRTGAPRKSWHEVHKALADPLRIRLLEWLIEAPRSARQLAGCAGLPADRLYYHLGQLEQAGLIEVAGYRRLDRGKDLTVSAHQCPELKAFLNTILTLSDADPLA